MTNSDLKNLFRDIVMSPSAIFDWAVLLCPVYVFVKAVDKYSSNISMHNCAAGRIFYKNDQKHRIEENI